MLRITFYYLQIILAMPPKRVAKKPKPAAVGPTPAAPRTLSRKPPLHNHNCVTPRISPYPYCYSPTPFRTPIFPVRPKLLLPELPGIGVAQSEQNKHKRVNTGTECYSEG
jgi:hypothetical protein